MLARVINVSPSSFRPTEIGKNQQALRHAWYVSLNRTIILTDGDDLGCYMYDLCETNVRIEKDIELSSLNLVALDLLLIHWEFVEFDKTVSST